MRARHTARGPARLVETALGRIQGAVEAVLDRRRGLPPQAARAREPGGGRPEERPYEASPWGVLGRVLPRREVSASDVFLEVGCGYGRVVVEAAGYPFRTVIGVERAPELAHAAGSAVARNAGRLRCGDVRVVASDALDFEIPDDVSVVYMNSPFVGRTFQAFVAALLDSFDRAPRRVRLVYMYPVEHDHLVASGRFRQVRLGRRRVLRWRRAGYLRLYEVIGAPGA